MSDSNLQIPPGALVFIAGTRRSGTTLVNNILCADPHANPHIGEAQPLTHLLQAFAWCADNHERMTRHYLPTRQALDEFANGVCRDLVGQCWNTQGRPRHLVLKNPELTLHLPALQRCFPSARFVVCVRDPRDQIASERDVISRRSPTGVFSANALAQAYVRSLECALRAAEAAPQAFCFVRYESLVTKPAQEVARLGSFCGLDLSAFDPDSAWQRMAVTQEELARRPSFSPLYAAPVSSSRVGRFREVLSDDDIARIEQATGPLMQQFGYGHTVNPVPGQPA
jgi:hypothetical protein